jgi:hypothetical protein
MNREVGFRLRKSWKPLICSLKKPQHDARSTRLRGYKGQYTLAISSPVATRSVLALQPWNFSPSLTYTLPLI